MYQILLLLLSLSIGCGSRSENGSRQKPLAKNKPVAIAHEGSGKPKSSMKTSDAKKEDKKKVTTSAESSAQKRQPDQSEKDRIESEKTPPAKQANYASLGDLLKQPADSMSRMIPNYPRIRVDDQKAAAAGIRKIAGKRITLYTDVPGKEIDRLPEIFDLAFPQYCDYFGVKPESVADWRATGFLIKDKDRFAKAGLIPAALPNFLNGFSWNYDLWLFDQKDDYYRRHLLLHEGVHSFMNTVLGGCGTPWYMEGMAEMLSTHAWHDGRLMLNYFPQNREEVPGLGRIRIIHDEVAARRAMPLAKIISYPPSAHHSNDAYAWSWAAAKFLDTHPRYQKRFRELYKDVLHGDFNANFYKIFADDLPELSLEWQVFAADLEYGYDIPRTVIDFTPGKPIAASSENTEPPTVRVASDRGWQNSGIRLEAGRKYELTASGCWNKKCIPAFWSGIEDLPEQIAIEPNGISIRYYHGQPLGILQAAVRPDHPSADEPAVFLNPITIGLEATVTPEESGTLFFKLNDTAADLRSNEGEVRVEIR